MTDTISRAAVLAILRSPKASGTFPDMIRRVEALEGCGVRVRPLRWWTTEHAPSLYVAGNPFAEYRVNKALVSGMFYVRFNLLKGGFADYYPTLEAAKAAAQADYEDRILAALEPMEPKDE